jgi:molecular chaperone DnaJ
MLRRYHPDKNRGSKEAEAKFIKIQQAYEVLKDEKQRRAYDAARKYSSSRSSSRGAQQPGDGQQGDALSQK